MNKAVCCNLEAVWIENVVGKGYLFCKECRNEVNKPVELSQAVVDFLTPNIVYRSCYKNRRIREERLRYCFPTEQGQFVFGDEIISTIPEDKSYD